MIKRSVASLRGPGLLNGIPNFLFYKTLRGLGFPLMVKVFVVLSVNFSEIQQVGHCDFKENQVVSFLIWLQLTTLGLSTKKGINEVTLLTCQFERLWNQFYQRFFSFDEFHSWENVDNSIAYSFYQKLKTLRNGILQSIRFFQSI